MLQRMIQTANASKNVLKSVEKKIGPEGQNLVKLIGPQRVKALILIGFPGLQKKSSLYLNFTQKTL